MRPKVLVAGLPSLIREGLDVVLASRLELIHTSRSHGQALIEDARTHDAVALITDPSEINALHRNLPHDLLLIGLSRSSSTMLVCWGEDKVEFSVARGDTIIDVVCSWARSIPRPVREIVGMRT